MTLERCVVCGRTPAARHLTHGGSTYGPACDDTECQCLAWEAHFLWHAKASQDEIRLLRWQMRRHSARVNGRPFGESRPSSAAERRLTVALLEAGLGSLVLAMEVE